MSSREAVAYFSVGLSPELHATVWRLWSPIEKGDVYLGPRFVASYHKLSIHSSGVRHLRRSGPDAREQDPERDWVSEGEGEHRWHGPERRTPGFELVWRIVTPASELREARLHPRFKKHVLWVPPGPNGAATEFLLLLSFGLIYPETDWPTRDTTGGTCIVRWRLGNGETFYLVQREAALSEAHARWFEDERQGHGATSRVGARVQRRRLRLPNTSG